MNYIISIPIEETGEVEQYGFPDTENMYGFLDLLVNDGFDISNIILPEGSLA
jgi:hypothetical protein